MADHPPACQISFCIFILLIISVGLYAGSFQLIDPLHAGLAKNTISGSVDRNTIYTSGRYFLGLGKQFVQYPATLQTIEFSNYGGNAPPLSAGTVDVRGGGATMLLEVSLQYRLALGQLGQLYTSYAQNYKSKLVSTAESTIKNVASERFSVNDYFTIREEVAEVFHAAVNLAYKSDYASCELFQLRNTDPPTQTENSIINTLVTQEQQSTARQIKLSDLVRNDTANLAVQTDITIQNEINARAQAQSKIIIETARAEAVAIKLDAYGQAYSYMRDQLNFTSDGLLTHFFYENLRQLESPSQILINLKNALISV
jgi:regulator of protease activity HflC (stomatin/prohibitin superfamily)